MREQSDFLDHVSDHAAQANHVPVADGAAVDIDFSVALQQETVDELEGCGFAGAAAAEEDQGFAAQDFQIQIAEKFIAGIQAIGDILELDCGAVVGRIVHAELFSPVSAAN